MAHGLNEDWEEGNTSPNVKQCADKKVTGKPVKEGKGIGSRRIFTPQFKLQVLESYRKDSDCRGNQRATARKYGIHRRQIQKWLQMECSIRCSAEASESGKAALNLASGRQRDDSSPCNAGGLPAPERSHEQRQLVDVDKVTDSEDELSSNGSLYAQDRALDFTCAALSKRRFFSLDFKLEVIDAFYQDPACSGNQRATARKFGIHRRQVQKWLDHEGLFRGEAENECLDLSKKRKLEPEEDTPLAKRIGLDLEVMEQPTSVQETALCLVKQPCTPPEVTSSVDLYRPYSLCCHRAETTYDPGPWNAHYYPYYGVLDTSYVTEWLSHDAQYYRQTVNDVNRYAPMYS